MEEAGEVNKTSTGVMWGNKDYSVKIFLDGQDVQVSLLRLVARPALELFYRTHVTGAEDVVERLRMVDAPGLFETQCALHHTFGRNTIWMAIEVRKNGIRVDDLCRTFYGSLSNPVPRKGFWK